MEFVNTFATLGTFVVIAVTAIVAVIQLRHARGSNQIAALSELRETMESASFQAAQHFIGGDLRTKLQDPEFRYQLAHPYARSEQKRPLTGMAFSVGNFYESMGLLLKSGMVEPQLAMEMWSSNVVAHWEDLKPCTAIIRRLRGDGVWENSEYLAVLSEDWLAAHPKGAYPADMRRMTVEDEGSKPISSMPRR